MTRETKRSLEKRPSGRREGPDPRGTPIPGLALARALALLAASGLVAAALPGAVAGATTTSKGTSSLSTGSGSLSIGAATNQTISAPVGGTGSGTLPVADWSDTTGSGGGWNGTVAVSDFTYVGSWTQTNGTKVALAPSSSHFTGKSDGVEYTVTVTSGSATGITNYSWTSDDPTDSGGGSGQATNGTSSTIGTKGISINFSSSTQYPTGATYTIDAGTEAPSALTLDTTATGASVAPENGTVSPSPQLVGNGTTVTGGGVGSTSYGTAVKFVSAAAGTGMGTYSVAPGASITTDISSWLGTYTAGVQYSIVAGP